MKSKPISSFLVSAIMLAMCSAGVAQEPAPDQTAPKNSKSAPKLPKCSDSLPGLAVPDAPHGLFAIMFPNKQMQARTTRLLLHNPVVCGANFYLLWDQIDRGPKASPRYEWSEIDERIAPWIAAGKRINFITRATGYSGESKVTPDYVFDKVNSVECPNFGRVPVFWEKDFMRNYQEFMAAVVEHYGSNPNIGYIRFGLGGGGETYPACMFALKRHGFSAGVWRDYIFKMLDFEHSLNSPKH